MSYRRHLLYVAAMAACWSLAGPHAAEVPNVWGAPPGAPSVGQSGQTDVGASLPREGVVDRAPVDGSQTAAGESAWANLRLPQLWTENTWRQWSILLGAIFLGVAAGWIAAALLTRAHDRFRSRRWGLWAHVVGDLIGPGKLALIALGLAVGLAQVKGMSDALRTLSWKTLLLLYMIAVFWYAFNLVAVVELMLRRLAAKTESTLDNQVVPLVRKTLRIFLVVIGVMVAIDWVFERDIAAWLAGLGIAGIAVSLAAQDSLKNLFGSITILFDRPFKVGERIVFSGYDGTVEEIGFRSTKVRTLVGHLVTIPNAKIVSDPVENVSRRPSIRRIINVTIAYDTPREKVERAVTILREILDEKGIREPIRPIIDGDEFPPRVYFNDYNADSLNIIVIYWYAPPAYWDYLEHTQRLNLRIFEEFEKAGIEFAFPTQTVYLAGDPKREMAIRMLGKDL
jgi:MscS family membrane protein